MTRKVVKLHPLSSYNDLELGSKFELHKNGQKHSPELVDDDRADGAPPLVFHFDDDHFSALDTVNDAVIEQIKRLSSPQSIFEVALHKNVKYAFSRSNGCINNLASSLERYGYSVAIAKSRASSGATAPSFYALHHQFIVVTLNNEQFAVDPSIKDHFSTSNATKPLEAMLDAVPDVFVASLPRTLKVITLLALELNRCFSIQGQDLPPWRRLRSTLSKWKDVVIVANADAVALSVTGSKQALMHDMYPSKSQICIQEKLLRMGLSPTDIWLKSNMDDANGGGGGGDLKGGSPSSVLDHGTSSGSSSPRHHVPHKVHYGFHIATESKECVCCGLRKRHMRCLDDNYLKGTSSLVWKSGATSRVAMAA